MPRHVARLLLVVALLALVPGVGWAQSQEIRADNLYSCTITPEPEGRARQHCWDPSTTGLDHWDPTLPDRSTAWYSCVLERRDGYIVSYCHSPQDRWSQVTPTDW
jgi:hypothetical protein